MREGESEREKGWEKVSETQRSAEGCLFCPAALLNTELPLPKETEHKAQYRDVCVCVCGQHIKVDSPPHCTSDIGVVSALHPPSPH